MNRTKKLAYNAAAAAALQIITMIAGMITPRIMLTSYGSEINGLVSSVTQFVSYFTIVEAGLTSAVVFALYKPIANHDEDRIGGIVKASKKFYYQTGVIFLLLVAFLAVLYPIFVKTDALAPGLISILVFVSSVNSALEFFSLAKYSAILTADQKGYIKNIGSIIQTIINTVIVILLASFKVNIVVLKSVALSSIFLRSAFLYYYVRKNYSFLAKDVPPIYEGLEKRWSAFYIQVTQIVQKGAPTFLSTVFLTLKDVSVYTIFNMVMVAVSNLLDIVSSGLVAQFGEIIALDDKSLLQRVYTTYESVYYTLITAVYSLTFFLLMPFIQLYTDGVTDANYNQPIIGALFVINAYLYTLKNPQGMLVFSAGLYKEVRVQTTIQTMIIVIGGIILTPLLGLSGVLLALCLSNLYRCIDLFLFIPKHVTHLPVWNTVKRVIFSIFKFVIMFGIIRMIPINQMESYVDWLVLAIEYGIIVFVISIVGMIVFEKEQALEMKERLLKIFKK